MLLIAVVCLWTSSGSSEAIVVLKKPVWCIMSFVTWSIIQLKVALRGCTVVIKGWALQYSGRLRSGKSPLNIASISAWIVIIGKMDPWCYDVYPKLWRHHLNAIFSLLLRLLAEWQQAWPSTAALAFAPLDVLWMPQGELCCSSKY